MNAIHGDNANGISASHLHPKPEILTESTEWFFSPPTPLQGCNAIYKIVACQSSKQLNLHASKTTESSWTDNPFSILAFSF